MATKQSVYLSGCLKIRGHLSRAALTPSHLWVVEVEGGSAQRLTGGSFSLQTDQRDDAPLPAWSADGRRVAFARFPNPYWGPSFQSVIGGVDATGGDSSTVAAAAGATTAAYAGDSGLLAYLRPRDGDQNNGNAVYVVQEGVARDATAGLARNVDAYAWFPGGRSLLLEGIEGTRAALWVQPLDRPARRLELGDVMPKGKPSIAHTGATREMPMTWAVLDRKRVLNASLTYREQTLLLLYGDVDSAVPCEDLADWTEHPRRQDFNRDVLEKLHRARLIEWDRETDMAILSPTGIREVEANVLPRAKVAI